MNISIVSLNEVPKLKESAITYCAENWPKVQKTFTKNLYESVDKKDKLPLTYLLMKDSKIIGFYQIVKIEQIRNMNYLEPWLDCLFIDNNERGQALGAMLLEHGRKTAKVLGCDKIYLTTDHIQFYEKYGFKEIGLDITISGRLTKVYEKSTLDIE